MALFASVPFFHDPGLNEKQGAKDCPLSFSFGGANKSIQVFTASLADCGIFTLQMVYIDNSNAPAATKITLNGTQQCIMVPGQSQAYLRVLGSPEMLDFTIENDSAGAAFTVNLHWLNIVACDNVVWSSV